MEASVHHKVQQYLAKVPKGKLIFPSDFRGLGAPNAVKTALTRLQKEGKIQRIAQGIYLKPNQDPVLGLLYPSLEEIATEIARRDHARIKPTGVYALHRLGLSTQVPTRLVFLTDGAPRMVRIGNRTIKFKAAAPKKLATKGKISSLVIQALSELGEKGLTAELETKLRERIRQEDPDIVRHDLLLAPAWIAEKITSFAGLNL